ncbi:MAG TPA: bifunctional [glutamate--ammonia ligase]-adenylyl-L-tyrosine phosphorylase/[glutamate--ammonia-ligase] adenylyltransferase [Candidatus Margulisiibacteriota bacterium]|nr:bifunctional [glutamate--ammonia ligase]-adenylyl-L-tyrosine phosphorylase/[glutamate--ammonia-ligase] adenylyltransferase [Candidatus Margulisiibacteriota bacterium]
MEPVPQVLAHFGVDAARVARAADLVRPHAPAVAERLIALVAAAPDPAMALANWEALVESSTDMAGAGGLDTEELSGLFTLLGGSQVLSGTLRAAGAGWRDLFLRCWHAPPRSAADHRREIAHAATLGWEEFSERLRQVRHLEYLRIGLNDLAGHYTVDVTMTELSALAAGAFAAACDWAQQTLRAHYGELCVQDSSTQPTAVGTADSFVVLAMGKLGGGELNFSSDVDVMYLCASGAGETVGGPRGSLAAREYYTRLAELVTRALQEVTGAGFAFRVDLRLRPDGINGPIVNPLHDALLYYESYGQTWERTAMIPARPIAGAVELGEQFLREIRPFVYRRYLDFATVTDIKEMKARVEAELRDKAGRGNVKLGRGGIREIEFLVQVLQLINGGRDERLRTRGSLPTLARLVECGYLPADEGVELAAAYRFLRDVEHKIQIVHQRQTHVVPKAAREQETLARRLGYRGEELLAQLWRNIDRHTERVRRAFEKLFYEPAAETRRAGDPESVQLLRDLDAREPSIERLRALGFADPETSYTNLVLLRDGPVSARARPRRKKVLYELAPALLGTILRAADPDLALQNMATFVSAVGARTSFLALLHENPGTLRMLVDLFGGSQFLANVLIRHPEQIDTLVRADLVRVHRAAGDLAAELDRMLGSAPDFEDALDALRRFRNQEFLRIGVNDLQSLFEPVEVSRELTTLAEVCLRAATTLATRDVCARYGWNGLPGEMVILGLGKLGGAELNYNSDLDLIFVYDAAATSVTAHEQFSKLAQRLITVLQTTTREGIVYRIDTRLRPSGRSGPLVSSLEGFRRYHESSAQVWERQALIKARPVAGDAALSAAVAAIVTGFVYRAPLTSEEAKEIRRLRQRMERELARESREHINIKTGRGGLVDVEFLTQMLQLSYGVQEPRLRLRSTLDALDVLGEIGVLPAADHAVLRDGYRFLRRVENALRLAHDRPVEDIDRGRMDLTTVAKRMRFAGSGSAAGEALWHEYEVRREAIRACYERWFNQAAAGLPPLGSPGSLH